MLKTTIEPGSLYCNGLVKAGGPRSVGESSATFEAQDVVTGRPCLIREISPSRPDAMTRRQFQQAVSRMRDLQSSPFAPLLYTFTSSESCYLVESIPAGEPLSTLDRFTPEMFRALLEALAVLHTADPPLFHGALAASTVFASDSGVVLCENTFVLNWLEGSTIGAWKRDVRAAAEVALEREQATAAHGDELGSTAIRSTAEWILGSDETPSARQALEFLASVQAGIEHCQAGRIDEAIAVWQKLLERSYHPRLAAAVEFLRTGEVPPEPEPESAQPLQALAQAIQEEQHPMVEPEPDTEPETAARALPEPEPEPTPEAISEPEPESEPEPVALAPEPRPAPLAPPAPEPVAQVVVPPAPKPAPEPAKPQPPAPAPAAAVIAPPELEDAILDDDPMLEVEAPPVVQPLPEPPAPIRKIGSKVEIRKLPPETVEQKKPDPVPPPPAVAPPVVLAKVEKPSPTPQAPPPAPAKETAKPIALKPPAAPEPVRAPEPQTEPEPEPSKGPNLMIWIGALAVVIVIAVFVVLKFTSGSTPAPSKTTGNPVQTAPSAPQGSETKPTPIMPAESTPQVAGPKLPPGGLPPVAAPMPNAPPLAKAEDPRAKLCGTLKLQGADCQSSAWVTRCASSNWSADQCLAERQKRTRACMDLGGTVDECAAKYR